MINLMFNETNSQNTIKYKKGQVMTLIKAVTNCEVDAEDVGELVVIESSSGLEVLVLLMLFNYDINQRNIWL